uniref:Hydroxysteroid 17-beta dehydrogenase 2 n=1 Tax=Serinus canaria TaxID=9135 RepID=A0A8C9MVH7_SERCA
MWLCPEEPPGILESLWPGAGAKLCCSPWILSRAVLLLFGCSLYHCCSALFDRCTFQVFLMLSGSDTGIGHALAKHLDSLGFVVFAGVLNKDGPGAEELRRSCSQRLSVLQLDITNTSQVKEAYLTVSGKVQNAGLWGVVNNAGILGFPADGELLPMSTYRHCMEVNFFGAVEVSKTFLPLLRRSQGRLVYQVSIAPAGGIPLPRYAAYGASKAALSMFSGPQTHLLPCDVVPAGIEGTAEQWDKQEKELMENLPADTRQAYGEEYLLGLRNYLLHLPSHCAPDLSPVLGSVLHALLARRPQGLYTPGKGAYFVLTPPGPVNLHLALLESSVPTFDRLGSLLFPNFIPGAPGALPPLTHRRWLGNSPAFFLPYSLFALSVTSLGFERL